MNFYESVIHEIKLARSESEVVKAIDNSFSTQETINANHGGSYHILNMIITLQVALAEALPEDARRNVKMAMKIFREYQKLTPGRII